MSWKHLHTSRSLDDRIPPAGVNVKFALLSLLLLAPEASVDGREVRCAASEEQDGHDESPFIIAAGRGVFGTCYSENSMNDAVDQ